MKTIRTIIDNFPHHGVIDIFSLYPTKDIISAIIALSRLQRIALYAEDKFDKFAIDKDIFSTASSFMSNGNDDFDQRTDYAERVESVDLSEQELLYELAHYSAYAHGECTPDIGMKLLYENSSVQPTTHGKNCFKLRMGGNLVCYLDAFI